MPEYGRSPEIEQDPIKRVANYAARLRREQKLSLREAVGRALDNFGISNEEREEMGDKVKQELGRRGGEKTARKRQRKEQEAREHWRAEAERAGFSNIEDFLGHINE